jgi:molybdopterin molybdotransferase
MTGAVMPAGCDTVVPQEFTRNASDTTVTIPLGVVRTGDNRRHMGEDLLEGKAALTRGRMLRPADLGLLASLGIGQVMVQRRLRVAFFSTGDELRSLGDPLDPGCIYDSNRYTLFGMLTRLGCELIDMGVVKDDPASLEAALRSACANADAIITSGGVSVGAADYTKQIMAQLGDVTFWKIGMRPGRPMAFGTVTSKGKTAYLFGLPGNPVAVMVTFYFFARDALLRMMGAQNAAAARATSRISDRHSQETWTHRIPARHPLHRRARQTRCTHHRLAGLRGAAQHVRGQLHGGASAHAGQCEIRRAGGYRGV